MFRPMLLFAAGIAIGCAAPALPQDHAMCASTPNPITRNAGGYFTVSDDLEKCKTVIGALNGMRSLLSWDKVSDLGFGCGDGTILKMGSTVDETGGSGLTFGIPTDKKHFVERTKEYHTFDSYGNGRRDLDPAEIKAGTIRYQSDLGRQVGECVLQCPGTDPDLTSVPNFVQDENFHDRYYGYSYRPATKEMIQDGLGNLVYPFYDGHNTVNCTSTFLLGFFVFLGRDTEGAGAVINEHPISVPSMSVPPSLHSSIYFPIYADVRKLIWTTSHNDFRP